MQSVFCLELARAGKFVSQIHEKFLFGGGQSDAVPDW
jgi:hypothetical protein